MFICFLDETLEGKRVVYIPILDILELELMPTGQAVLLLREEKGRENTMYLLTKSQMADIKRQLIAHKAIV